MYINQESLSPGNACFGARKKCLGMFSKCFLWVRCTIKKMIKSSRYAAAEIFRFINYSKTETTRIWMCVSRSKWIMKLPGDTGPKDFVSIDIAETVEVAVKDLGANVWISAPCTVALCNNRRTL